MTNSSPPASLLGRAAGLLAAKSVRAPSGHIDFSRLDLRPPETSMAPAQRTPSDTAPAFPSFKRQAPLMSDQTANDLPALGLGHARIMSKPEEIARRVQHEGLPLARLWETHSALLSLGLSPHGKPGLWLIQKVP